MPHTEPKLCESRIRSMYDPSTAQDGKQEVAERYVTDLRRRVCGVCFQQKVAGSYVPEQGRRVEEVAVNYVPEKGIRDSCFRVVTV